MKVKATKVGWDGFALRKVGEVFDYSGKLGSWMEKVTKKAVKPTKPVTKKAVKPTKPVTKKAVTKKATK